MEDLENTINRYLDDEMSPDELAAFEKRIKDEPVLAEAIEDEKDARRTLRLMKYQQVREQVENVRQNMPRSPRGSLRPWMVAAPAAVIVLLAVAFFLLRTNSLTSLSNQNLSETPFAGFGSLGSDANEVFTAGKEAYDRGDFEEALDIWKPIRSSQDIFVETRLYMGQAYLKLENPSKALETLTELQPISTGRSRPWLNWLLALSHLANEDKDQTLSHLDLVIEDKVNSPPDLGKSAQKLKEDLR